MVVVWIRHFTKAYRNGGSTAFPLDPPVLPDTEGVIPRLRAELLARYGSPNRIVASPYLRCRETARALGAGKPVRIETRVAEYLSARRQHPEPTSGQVQPETALHPLPHNERACDLRRRVRSFLRWLQNQPPNSVCWVITHGSVIRAVTREMGHSYYPQPLEAVVVTEASLLTHYVGSNHKPVEDPDQGCPATLKPQLDSSSPPEHDPPLAAVALL